MVPIVTPKWMGNSQSLTLTRNYRQLRNVESGENSLLRKDTRVRLYKMSKIIFRYEYVYTYMHVAKVNAKEAINLKISNQGYMGAFGVRKGRRRKVVTIISKFIKIFLKR